MYGKLKHKIWFNQDTGEVVNEQPYYDQEESLGGEYLLSNHLNGVIWYSYRISQSESEPTVSIDAAVIPNPHYHKGQENLSQCEKLHNTLFDEEQWQWDDSIYQ